jgi:hypothetical protein
MEALKSSITRFGFPRKEMGFCKAKDTQKLEWWQIFWLTRPG